MPHTLLVSFSLLALVVTARPIAPVSYVSYDVPRRSQLTYICPPTHPPVPLPYSDYSQPAEVQNAIKAIFEERTKFVRIFLFTLITFLINVFRQSNIDLLGLTQGEVDIRLISDEGQQAVLSQLDGGAVKALVPLAGTESAMPPEVQSLREMLGSSKHLDDIEGAPYDELEGDVEIPTDAVKEPEPSESTLTTSSSWESARLSLTSLLAVYTFISLAVLLYAFYLIRGLLSLSQDEAEMQAPRHGDVESRYSDEKCTATQEKASDLGNVFGTPQISHPPVGALVNNDEDVMMVAGEPDLVVEGSMPNAAASEVPAVVEQPWLVPLPPSPPSSPPRRTIQLDEEAPVERNSQPAWAMMASDEQRRPDARTGTAAPAIDLALAMQLRTGFGATADAAWLMRFLMALFGWIAVIVRGGVERQATGRRLLAW